MNLFEGMLEHFFFGSKRLTADRTDKFKIGRYFVRMNKLIIGEISVAAMLVVLQTA